jgi:hypothetical protein
MKGIIESKSNNTSILNTSRNEGGELSMYNQQKSTGRRHIQQQSAQQSISNSQNPFQLAVNLGTQF